MSEGAATWRARASACLRAGDARGALVWAMRASAVDSSAVASWVTLGRAFSAAGSHDLAAGAYDRAAALAPGRPDLSGRALHQRLMACDWQGLDAAILRVEAMATIGVMAIDPFSWQAVSPSPRASHAVALAYEAREPAMVAVPPPVHVHHPDDRIRIGYVSGEFHDHATSVLMAGVWEHHDRARFEVIGFDNGIDPPAADPMRGRVRAALDRLVPIRELSTEATVAAVRARGIDVLVDLNGYFGESRGDLFRARAAPVQVSYLGFPGTVGAGWMDYILADHVVIPDDERRFYTEKVVRLPHSYQANDDRRTIAVASRPRAAHGLPETGFVFACFNNSYKLTPAMMDRWAAILARVPGSVLWLIDDNPAATRNLRLEASRRGIDPTRLVFAPRIELPDHLARHVHADLFLDTLPYGAHTTASDALWAGLPVLTTPGATFPGRVAASLLNALDLPDLIAPTPAAYAERAVALAHDPAALAELRVTLAANRSNTPLFDTARTTRDLERAFAAMDARARAWLPPEHLDLR